MPFIPTPTPAAPASIAGTVWVDRDEDGTIDASEARLEGVEVTLYGSDGEKIATTATDVAGKYVFADLPAGAYRVERSLPAGYEATTADETLAAAATLSSVPVTLEPGDEVRNLDAALLDEPIDLAVDVTSNHTTIAAGDPVDFTTQVTNVGPGPLSGGAGVTVRIPSNLRIDGVDAGTGWDVDIVNQIVTAEWTERLDPNGTTPSIIVRTTVIDESPSTTSATVSAPRGSREDESGNNTKSVDLTPVARATTTPVPSPTPLSSATPAPIATPATPTPTPSSTPVPVPTWTAVQEPIPTVTSTAATPTPVGLPIPTVESPPQALAFTGSSNTRLVVSGLALILAGFGLVLLARRRLDAV